MTMVRAEGARNYVADEQTVAIHPRSSRQQLWSPVQALMIRFYSPQMVATIDTTKYTIESDLTKKEKKEKANTQTNDMYLSKAD